MAKTDKKERGKNANKHRINECSSSTKSRDKVKSSKVEEIGSSKGKKKSKQRKSKLDNIKKYLSKIKTENIEIYGQIVKQISEKAGELDDFKLTQGEKTNQKSADVDESKSKSKSKFKKAEALKYTRDKEGVSDLTLNVIDSSHLQVSSESNSDQEMDASKDSENDSDSSSSSSSSSNLHTTRSSEPEGVKRFPNFSAEFQESQVIGKEADLMGIPEWIRNPRVVDSTKAFSINDKRFELCSQTISNCKKEGISELFAVQVVSLPLLKSNYIALRYSQRVRDVCISAPTGSGKTLAYVIPIVEKLIPRVVRRLRAVVVLPTRDLASQVKKVFEKFIRGTNIKVGLASGESSFQKEQLSLVENPFTVTNEESSKVDILVCTPGRLIDHISQTANFSLENLEILVMDEADRLLSQGYNDWLNKIYISIEKFHNLAAKMASPDYEYQSNNSLGGNSNLFNSRDNYILLQPQPRVQKLLFSATLTKDPSLISSLKLYNPLYVAIKHQRDPEASDDDNYNGQITYETPSTLKEYYHVCSSYNKPLALLYLLLKMKVNSVLCFAKSVEAAHRLSQLLNLLLFKIYGDNNHLVIEEYSGDLNYNQRSNILKQFKNNKIQVLICSDIVSRGIDIENVGTVINYDVAISINQYIHRVGRTARAGKEGSAFSLVGSHEARYFRKMNHTNNRMDKIQNLNIKNEIFEEYIEQYQSALDELKDLYVSKST